MMIRKLLALSLFASTVCAQVDEAGAGKVSFTLEEAQAYAIEHGYSVQDKQLEFAKARQTIKETASRGLPQITANLDFTYNAQIAQQPVPAEFFGGPPGTFATVAFGTRYQNIAGVSLNQLLLDGSYFVALQASKVYKEGARLDQEISEIEIRSDVSQAYYGVLVSEEIVEILRENRESLQTNFEETRALYENGFMEEQDVDQLELLVSNLTNSLDQAERQHTLAIMLLNFNLGRNINQEIELTSTIADVMATEEIMLKDAFSLEENASYKYVEIQETGAHLNVKNEKWKYYPTLSGFARHGQSNFTNDFDEAWNMDTYWIPNTSLGLSLQWTLLEGLKRPATVQKAKLDLEKAEVAKEMAGNQLRMQYEQARSAYQFALDSYNTQTRNVELSKRIRDKTRIKYQEGISSSLELTQAENQYLEAQQKYINTLQSLLNAKEALILAIGKK